MQIEDAERDRQTLTSLDDIDQVSTAGIVEGFVVTPVSEFLDEQTDKRLALPVDAVCRANRRPHRIRQLAKVGAVLPDVGLGSIGGGEQQCGFGKRYVAVGEGADRTQLLANVGSHPSRRIGARSPPLASPD